MELVLNLAWLLLALPACWIWWRDGADAYPERGVGSGQCLLALGCVLVLLFPVISATDDLHAMRAEMEESATNKHSIRQAGTDKVSDGSNRVHASPAASVMVAFRALDGDFGQAPVSQSFPLPAAPSLQHASRAPPFSNLG